MLIMLTTHVRLYYFSRKLGRKQRKTVGFQKNHKKATYEPKKVIKKIIHNPFMCRIVDNVVDKVHNLCFQYIFTDFYNVSGAHSYQQVAVD